MSNQYRGNRSPDSQGYSNRQSDDFGTQDRRGSSSNMPGEADDEFGSAPRGYTGRQDEMDAGHGSGSGRGYGRQASPGWDQDYGFAGRQSGEPGARGAYSAQGYDQSNQDRSGRRDDGQRGGMGYGEQGAMGYGETGVGRSGWEGGRNASEDRHGQAGNRMYGESRQRGFADHRPRSGYEQQGWGAQRDSQGSFRGRERNLARDAGSPDDRDGWQERGPHAGRGPKGWRRSDERITEDLCEALTRHSRIDATDIEVRVEQGDVTLSGTVDSREAKRAAEELAERCSGVTDVTNQLRVKREDRAGAEPASRSRSAQQEASSTAGSHGQNGHAGRQDANQDRTATAGNGGNGIAMGKD